jgi:hypothetical protein
VIQSCNQGKSKLIHEEKAIRAQLYDAEQERNVIAIALHDNKLRKIKRDGLKLIYDALTDIIQGKQTSLQHIMSEKASIEQKLTAHAISQADELCNAAGEPKASTVQRESSPEMGDVTSARNLVDQVYNQRAGREDAQDDEEDDEEEEDEEKVRLESQQGQKQKQKQRTDKDMILAS